MSPKTFILLAVVSSVVASNDVGQIWRRALSDERPCEQTGYMCEDCTHYSFCFVYPNGTGIQSEIFPCPDGETCHEDISYCAPGPNLDCDTNLEYYKFDCYQLGIFPHPFNCKQYHICIQNSAGTEISKDPQVIDCPEGFGYDIRSSRCSRILENDRCTEFQLNMCSGIGDMGPIEDNPSLFYACLPTTSQGIPYYFPQIFQCPGNYEFFDGECQNPTPQGIEDGRCIAVGNFFEPSDCTAYYECSFLGNIPIIRLCSPGYHFDPKSQACAPYQC